MIWWSGVWDGNWDNECIVTISCTTRDSSRTEARDGRVELKGSSQGQRVCCRWQHGLCLATHIQYLVGRYVMFAHTFERM